MLFKNVIKMEKETKILCQSNNNQTKVCTLPVISFVV